MEIDLIEVIFTESFDLFDYDPEGLLDVYVDIVRDGSLIGQTEIFLLDDDGVSLFFELPADLLTGEDEISLQSLDEFSFDVREASPDGTARIRQFINDKAQILDEYYPTELNWEDNSEVRLRVEVSYGS